MFFSSVKIKLQFIPDAHNLCFFVSKMISCCPFLAYIFSIIQCDKMKIIFKKLYRNILWGHTGDINEHYYEKAIIIFNRGVFNKSFDFFKHVIFIVIPQLKSNNHQQIG